MFVLVGDQQILIAISRGDSSSTKLGRKGIKSYNNKAP
jgi:hypothetical protein